MNVFIKGLNGCWMRQTDLQRYRDLFLVNGHTIVDDPAESDLILLWTCAFRRDYRDNSLAQIERYLKDYKAEVIVAGCLPDIDQELLHQHFKGRVLNWRDDESKIKEFFRTFNKTLGEIERNVSESKLCDDVAEYRKQHPDKPASFADQFIKLHISEGCRFECTYCSELLAFPPYRSFSESILVEACKLAIEKSGHKEIMLLGDSIGDYGHDIDSSLPLLMQKIKAIDAGVTISLHGLNPAHFIKFFDEMASFLAKGVIKHISLPIQSASEHILKLMKRSYTRAEIDRIFTLFNDIKFAGFETHLIIGFPGESEVDFEETLNFVLRHRPKYVLASGFMETFGAPASMLPGKVDEDTKRRRLREAGERIQAAGIICNTDDSALSAARFHTLNHIDIIPKEA
ncbi:MAG: radical SAM protein [Geobacteraceae bacterium]|nr:radical SAM protein [Geobacteraceae bacterium]NTW79391.1 radical SAM protein [Geobacteraceae bacterium]